MARDPSAVGNQHGQRVGKYELLDHVATGGMGAVYRARDTETDQEVALKVLTRDMAAKPAMVERFRREARTAARLSHENIVRVFDYGEADGTIYLAMEFVEGIDLHEHIENKGKLDPEESRQIMLQAARALAHAAEHGVVHRDVKPSNFLLTKKHGRLVVKLTDLGLAREQDDGQFRVTRAGTTVGTVDYIAPEQARDSGVADHRSDLYSLGCTWFHMLTGQPPFAKGGLAERLVKHMEAAPPDVRKLNAKVSDALAAVLNRLLAKHPDDRYQTAQELLQALQELSPTRKSASQRDTDSDLPSAGRKKPKTGAAKRRKGGSTASDAPKPKKGSAGMVAVVAGLLVLGGAAAAYLALNPPAPPNDPTVGVVEPGKDRPKDGSRPKDDSRPKDADPPKDGPVTKDGTGKTGTPPPPKPKFPPLYAPATAIAVESLAARFRTPWNDNARPPADAPVLRVSRAPDGQPGWHPTVESALAAIPDGQTAVVELHDHGPLFEPSLKLAGRSVVLRPGKGFSPLLVWDLTPKDRPSGSAHFVAVEKGHLWVEDLEVVTTWPEALPPREDAVFAVRDGDLNLRDVAVAVAGRHDALAVARLTGDRARGRFERVVGRGDGLAVVAVDAVRAEVGFDGCLFVGGAGPLVQVATSDDRDVRLWAARSTFVGRKTLVEARATDEAKTPGLRLHWWDCLLTRMGPAAEGELLRLPAAATRKNLDWLAVNCLYVGWPVLLAGPAAIAGGDVGDWLAHWERPDGEVARPNPWPAPAVNEVETKPAATFRTLDTPLAFGATSDPDRPLGAPLDKLPAARDDWPALAAEHYPLPTIAYLDGTPPAIPNLADGLYHGEVLDLATTPDVGAHLAKQRKLGPRVVLHLKGTGDKATSLIKVPAGTTLALYAEPPTATEAPLALRFAIPAGSPAAALIATEGGGLELSNLDVKPPEGAFARSTPYLLQAKGGPLKLFRCRLQSPPAGLPGLKALVSLDGSGDADKAHHLAVAECVLTTGQTSVRVAGTGALVGVQGSLLLAGGPAVEFEPGPRVGPRVGLGASLDGSTVASRGPTVVVGATQAAEAIKEPLTILSRGCLFLHPFEGGSPALLNARGATLAGGVVWQSEEDVIDGRITRPIVAGDDGPGAVVATATRTWGSAAVRKAVTVPGLKATLDAKSWGVLDALALPARVAGLGDRKPGADLVAIRAIKKKP